MKKHPIVLSLSGGGDRTYLLAGIVFGLKETFGLKHINVVSGSSYSVPIALKSKTVTDALNRISYFNILDYVKRIPSSQILEKHGLFELEPKIYHIIETLTGIKDPRTAHITPVATKLGSMVQSPVYLSTLRYGKGAAISMSFPFLIAPTKYNNMYLSDGGISGQVHYGNLKKFRDKVPIVGIYFNSSTDLEFLMRTIYRGLQYLNIPKFKIIKDLFLLLNKDELLQPIKTIHTPRFSVSNISNLEFEISGYSNVPMLLPLAEKKKLFLEGYQLSAVIISRIMYYIRNHKWKQLTNFKFNISRDIVLTEPGKILQYSNT